MDRFDPKSSGVDTEALHSRYISAEPFPHIVIDGFFPEATLDRVLDEFATHPGEDENQSYNTHSKRRGSDMAKLGPATRALIEDMHAPSFLRFLQDVTGIKGLIPDPFLLGGGTHEIGKGGFLKVHTDFNWHRLLKLHRRVNLLLYLNKDWQESWKGGLELWNTQMTTRADIINPEFNRMVLFSTSDFSYHGHPDPLECPDGVTRKSIALYFYSSERPKDEISFGKSMQTNWKSRPGENFEVNPLRYAASQTLLRLPFARAVLRKLGKQI